MRWENTPEDEALKRATLKGIAPVFIPAAVAIFLLLYFLVPRRPPTSQAWANGTYVNACCDPITLKNGLLVSGAFRARYKIDYGKRGFFARFAQGIEVEGRGLKQNGHEVEVDFNRVSEAQPAIREPESLHLFHAQTYDDVTFTKQ